MSAEDGIIRSISDEGGAFVPQQGWQYYDTNAWTTDDTVKVTHHYSDQKEIMIAVKLLGIMASSLLLIALMVTCLGTYAI